MTMKRPRSLSCGMRAKKGCVRFERGRSPPRESGAIFFRGDVTVRGRYSRLCCFTRLLRLLLRGRGASPVGGPAFLQSWVGDRSVRLPFSFVCFSFSRDSFAALGFPGGFFGGALPEHRRLTAAARE